MKENWKKIDFNNTYSISDLGRVRNDLTKRILKPFNNTFGYEQVELGNKQVLVSRLAAKAFVANPDPIHKTQVNHLNENPVDNRATNLSWVTPKENMNYGTRSQRSGIHHRKKVVAINNYTKETTIYESVTEAKKKTGIDNVSAYCKGKMVESKSGLTFRYYI
jgi:hypothetical protein